MSIKKISKYSFLVLSVGFAISFIALGSRVQAATLTLSGNCSIDEAITNANNDDQSGSVDCAAGSGTDTISIPAGTFSFSADNTITSDINFVGEGLGVSILDGGDSFGGLFCDGSGGPYEISVSDLTIQNVLTTNDYQPLHTIDCNTQITDVEVTGNSGATNVTLEGESFTYVVDGLNVHDSEGYGLAVEGVSDVSTVSGTIDRLTASNLETFGLYIACDCTSNGNSSFNSTLDNSTITNNQIGIISFIKNGNVDINLTVRNSTIVNNIPSVNPYLSSNIVATVDTEIGDTQNNIITLQNTIVAGSDSLSCSTDEQGVGTESASITSLGNNLSDDTSCNLNATGDQENVTNFNDYLGPLQDNGGGIPTIELLAGSTAIDAGATILGITTDQRGVSRPVGVAYDIGAYEASNSGTPNPEGGNSQGGSGGDQAGLANTGTPLVSNILLISVFTIAMYAIKKLVGKNKPIKYFVNYSRDKIDKLKSK